MPFTLREIQYEDLPLINKWRNDPEIIAWLGNNFLYITKDVDADWYRNYLQHRDKAVRFAIVENATNAMVGTAQLTDMHAINRAAEFSIAIGEKEYWNKGAGHTAIQMIIQHGFQDLNLHRIYLRVLARNVRAIHLYKKAGFLQEGILRQSLYKQGVFEDEWMMAMLKEDYIQWLQQ